MLAGYRERAAAAARRARGRRAARRPLPARARVLVQPPGDRPRARARWASPTASRATVSSEEVARGKPAPDVYLEALRRLGVDDARAAIEDSENGIRSAHAAGLRVIAIPNPHFPPGRRGARARRRGPAGPRRGAAALGGGERVVARRVQREARRGAGDLQQAPDRALRRDDVQALARGLERWAARRIVPSALESMKSTPTRSSTTASCGPAADMAKIALISEVAARSSSPPATIRWLPSTGSWSRVNMGARYLSFRLRMLRISPGLARTTSGCRGANG